jgi:hypothetical protein
VRLVSGCWGSIQLFCPISVLQISSSTQSRQGRGTEKDFLSLILCQLNHILYTHKTSSGQRKEGAETYSLQFSSCVIDFRTCLKCIPLFTHVVDWLASFFASEIFAHPVGCYGPSTYRDTTHILILPPTAVCRSFASVFSSLSESKRRKKKAEGEKTQNTKNLAAHNR